MEKKKRGKKGGVLKVMLIIFLVLVVLIIGVGIYFYNFHVFKTVKVCISENTTDTKINCSSNQFCIDDIFKNSSVLQERINNSPKFVGEKMVEIFNSAIVCDNTCRIKQVKGLENPMENTISSCLAGEKEIKLEVHGKEAVQFALWMKKQSAK